MVFSRHRPSHAEGYAKLTGTPGSPVPPSLEITTSVGTFVSVGTVPLTIPDSADHHDPHSGA